MAHTASLGPRGCPKCRGFVVDADDGERMCRSCGYISYDIPVDMAKNPLPSGKGYRHHLEGAKLPGERIPNSVSGRRSGSNVARYGPTIPSEPNFPDDLSDLSEHILDFDPEVLNPPASLGISGPIASSVEIDDSPKRYCMDCKVQLRGSWNSVSRKKRCAECVVKQKKIVRQNVLGVKTRLCLDCGIAFTLGQGHGRENQMFRLCR